MRNVLCLLLVSLSVMLCAGCDKDDNEGMVPAEVLAEFDSMFPKAKHTHWADEELYYKVSFVVERIPKTAWFRPSGEWAMTDTDLPAQNLPRPIHTDIAVGEFSGKRIEKIHSINVPERDDLFIILMDVGRDSLAALYYTRSGNFFKKEFVKNDVSVRPVDLPQCASETVSGYVGYEVMSVELESGVMEVCLVSDTDMLSVILGFENRSSDSLYGHLVYSWRQLLPENFPEGLDAVLAERGFSSDSVVRVYEVYNYGELFFNVVVRGNDGNTFLRVEPAEIADASAAVMA